MNVFTILVLIVLISSLSGCIGPGMVLGGGGGMKNLFSSAQKADLSECETIKPGQTTREELEKKFGKPVGLSNDGSVNTIRYKKEALSLEALLDNSSIVISYSCSGDDAPKGMRGAR
ncbi:MAG: hypothetical protein EPN22_17070 [Nitrospirae bacterium]|nr:MAG: hypothetical protein EPN22_17070 [Nitrospirota bacterium]